RDRAAGTPTGKPRGRLALRLRQDHQIEASEDEKTAEGHDHRLDSSQQYNRPLRQLYDETQSQRCRDNLDRVGDISLEEPVNENDVDEDKNGSYGEVNAVADKGGWRESQGREYERRS